MSKTRHTVNHSLDATVASLTSTVVEDPSPSESHFSEEIQAKKDSMPTLLYQENPARMRGEITLDSRAVPPVIPPDHPNRTLIVCFDGTGNQFDSNNSNVVQFVSLLKKDDKTKQLVYYQTGIGTYTSPEVVSPLKARVMEILDEMFALNLDAHVMGGYEFLMQNYIGGDKICLFGFSRGAYTARSLAGMLHKVGLLPAGNFQQVPFAYKMYSRADDVGWEQSNEFKKAISVDVSIEFIGVWDTVDSVGLFPKRLPFTTSNTLVRTFRHAVSLDEHRAKFKANLWNRPNKDELNLGTSGAPSSEKGDPCSPDGGLLMHVFGKKEDKIECHLDTLEKEYSMEDQKTTDVEEVWFAGCHCDIGGGSVSNKTRHSLARISLRWMVRECFKTNSGIMFNSASLLKIGLDPSTLYPFVASRPPPLPVSSHKIATPPIKPIPIRTADRLRSYFEPEVQALIDQSEMPFLGTEEDEELRDALSPKYDQLKIKKAWWILEILPLKQRYQRDDNTWVTYIGTNEGRPRIIPRQSSGFKVHRSVKIRMEAERGDERKRRKGKGYLPKPVFHHEPQWVD